MKHHETLEHLSFDATISVLDAEMSAIARSYRQYRRGVPVDIGDCGVDITLQMCNRVTNHGDMSTFSKPAIIDSDRGHCYNHLKKNQFTMKIERMTCI